MTQETKTIAGTGGGTFVTKWGYDAMDRLTWMKYPGGNAGQEGEQVSYTYIDQGLINTISGGGTYYVGGTSYDALGRVDLRKLGNDVLRQDYVYYPWTTLNPLTRAGGQGRLQYLKTGPTDPYDGLQKLEYTYDAVGNVASIKDHKVPGGIQTQSFSYDALDRLKTMQASGGISGQGQYGPSSYSYDRLGNLNAQAGGGTWVYGAQSSACPDGALSKPHAVVTAGGSTYCYDPNGNMVKRTVGGAPYTLTYDQDNRLTAVSGGTSAAFYYDADPLHCVRGQAATGSRARWAA